MALSLSHDQRYVSHVDSQCCLLAASLLEVSVSTQFELPFPGFVNGSPLSLAGKEKPSCYVWDKDTGHMSDLILNWYQQVRDVRRIQYV